MAVVVGRAPRRMATAFCALVTTLAVSGCAIGFVDSPPTNVTDTGATLNGSVLSDRSEQGAYWFEYGSSSAYGAKTPERTISFTRGVKRPVSEPVSGLEAWTEYHYRLCARGSDPKPLCSRDATLTTADPQITLGPDRPRYLLHIEAADGDSSDPQSGVAGVAILVDGEQVDASQPGCATQSCELSHDWTLNAEDYAPGQHTVTVRTTDEVGRTTTRELDVEIQRDTTRPSLRASGPLRSAPEGWVEQRNYTLSGEAADSGYGITSLKLLIDNQQVGQPATQPCPDGGCALNRTFTVNTANYGGGAHDVKLVATDGAGNSATRSWTMNVNPDGNVSTSEAAATVKAADSTADTTVVAPTSEAIPPQEIAEGNNPGLEQTGTTLRSTGTPATSTMTTDPADGFTISSPKDSIAVTPIGVSSAATSMGISSGAAAVSGDTASQVDTVVRPVFNGAMTFQSIRDATSPETFSWRVDLDADQRLTQVDDQTAEVYWNDGTPAMMISAQPAHDATGATVPTTISTSGKDVITLTVSHRAGSFVYPVVAGPGWQAAYVYVNPLAPSDPVTASDTDPGDPITYTDVGAPVVDRSLGESGWRRMHAMVHSCRGGILGCTFTKIRVSGYFRYNGEKAVRGTVAHPGVGCNASGLDHYHFGVGRGWFGPNPAYYRSKNAQWLTMYCNYQPGDPTDGICGEVNCHTEGHLFGSGYPNFDKGRESDDGFCPAKCDQIPPFH